MKARGQFLHDRELYMGPRTFIDKNINATKGSVFSAQTASGFLVITPFKLEDRECVPASLFLILISYKTRHKVSNALYI